MTPEIVLALLQRQQQASGQQLPGQQANQLNLDGGAGLMQGAGSTGQSGAVGIPQQQQQFSAPQNVGYQTPMFGDNNFGAVLPAKYDGINGTPDGLEGVPEPGMGDPSLDQNPMTRQRPGVTREPVGFVPQKTQPPRAINPSTQQPFPFSQDPVQNPGWGQLLNPFGTIQNPNALVRAGVGYNAGGLLGALGYLLTDMRQNQPTQQ